MSSPAASTLLDPSRLSGHLPRLTRIATRMTGSREAGEDLVQDTLERILRSPRRLAGDEFRYLVRSLRNNHVDRIRAEARRVKTASMDETLEAVLPAPDHTEVRTEAREVLAAVAALPEAYRNVVVAVDVAGYSYQEAADALGVPIGTVMSRLYRGRQRVVGAVEQPVAA
ncbi:MAG TPA: RNA polymerase sigma factor [Solirubrobacteraceae bacterium]|jgi:RNA polymerase sigma-70 factor (ECF subfamily)|nr:RNA polymerase sigma factor [Solirubrobacteraceae bacterium]